MSCLTCPMYRKSVFFALKKEQLKEMVQTRFKAKENLFSENSPGRGVYCITRGTVKLYRNLPSGRKKILSLLAPGDLAGLDCLCQAGAELNRAEATSETTACFISRENIQELMESSPAFSRELMKRICSRAQEYEVQLSQYANGSVRQRVAYVLCDLEKKFGPEIDLGLSRSDIASLAGTVLESAVRVLSDFKKEGLIRLEGRRIGILKLERLTEIWEDL